MLEVADLAFENLFLHSGERSGGVTSVAVSDATKTVVSRSYNQTVRIWDIETGQQRNIFKGLGGLVRNVAVNDATNNLVCGSDADDQTVCIWDLETDQKRSIFGSTNGHSESVTTMAVSVVTNTVVSGSEDQTVRIWNLETGQQLRVLEGHLHLL